jgi:hypothetical protein
MSAGGRQEKRAWKSRSYPVPTPTRSGIRLKAAALRTLHRWNGAATAHAATIMVPALYNFMPAESVALGWLNEIDALATIRQRMSCAARITGWDPFTFHTLHNADRYFDITIGAMRDTWVKEGNLSIQAIREVQRRFGKPCDYHRIHARLVENLVFQSSLLDWVADRASGTPLRVHVIGTALLSALVCAGSISFSAAVESATKLGTRWDETLRGMIDAKTEDDIGWLEFRQIRRLIQGRASLSMDVRREDLPATDAPAEPFWYSPALNGEPMLITTAQEAANALETLNLASWSFRPANSPNNGTDSIRGWLVSPLHPMARRCRWSVSNHLLATPASVGLFLEHIAPLGRGSSPQSATGPAQNRLRLSRMKVTGP